MAKHKFIAIDLLDKAVGFNNGKEIEADYIVLRLPNGQSFSLKYSEADGCATISTETGLLSIEPRAANVCRIYEK